MANITETEKESLFRKVRTLLGAPARKIQLNNNQLNDLLEISIENYTEYMQNWLIENQWTNLAFKDVTKTDLMFALSVRTLDFEQAFTYAYSKQVGLQARGPFEMKKDYVDIESGRQVYTIPAGRELNEVLYFTPSTVDASLMSTMGGGLAFDGMGAGGGFAQMGAGAGGGMNGTTGFYIQPIYDVLLTSQYLSGKQKMIRSDLTYKLTRGPNETTLLHLMSTPGSKLTFGGLSGAGSFGQGLFNLAGGRVWYHYYETNADNVGECQKMNPDIMLYPSDVPLSKMDYSMFNEPTKVLIRRLLVAESKLVLASIRGTFSGAIALPDTTQGKMDYEMFITQGVEEKKQALLELSERLKRLSNLEMLKRRAEEAKATNDAIIYIPLPWKIM